MASEIRVDKINSLSGVGTVTLSPTGVDIAGITTVSTLKVGTGVTASEDGNIFFTGIATATTFSGSGASLTALPAAQVTGTLPAISGANLTALNGSNIASGTVADARISTLTASKLSGALPAISALNLTNVPAANVVGVHTSLNVTGSTTVGGGVTISESGIEASGIGITCANINGTQIGGRRNIIINGAMNVAQRGTSSTASAIGSVDRFKVNYSGTDEAITQSQVDVASGTTPYTLGFRKSLRVTNGNQSSGAGSSDLIKINYLIEAQDIANSGWNYLSDSSYITLQFWVKSSVAQNFFGRLTSNDGTAQSYVFETGSLTADTWTKITKTVPGNSNLTFNNDNGNGLLFEFIPFRGTATTGTRPLNAWAAFDGSLRCPDMTSTWYTTNDSTLEITGVQFEVGSQATAFEHRSFGEELSLCQRYYYQNTSYGTVAQTNSGETVNTSGFGGITMYSATSGRSPFIYHPVSMRATPTVTFFSASNAAGGSDNKLSVYSGGTGWDNVNTNTAEGTTVHMGFKITTNDSFTAGDTLLMGGQFSCSAEL